MKKIAFYVEGQTEQFFINMLLIEIAGQKKIQIELHQFQGKGRPSKVIYPNKTSKPQNPQHHVLIFDCMGDGGVKSRILEDYNSLFTQGYSEVIGLRDLYPLPDLNKLENDLKNGVLRRGKTIIPPLPQNASIVVAVREIEDWFLAECNHYLCISSRLVLNQIQISSLGFNPYTDDLTTRGTSAASDLNAIYQLVGETYSKRKNKVERTVECLDYANLYFNLVGKFNKLNEIIVKIDNFLT